MRQTHLGKGNTAYCAFSSTFGRPEFFVCRLAYGVRALKVESQICTTSENIYILCNLLILAGKATPVGALPGITRSVMEKIKVGV